jgi:hypothetical protein
MTSAAHQRTILAFIKRMARHLRLATLLERGLMAVTVLLSVLLLGAGLVPLARSRPLLITVFVLLSWGALGVVGWWFARACMQRRSLEATALSIEAVHPELHNHLISALQLPDSLRKYPETGLSHTLVDRLLEVTQTQIEQLTAQPLVDWRAVWRQVLVVTPLVVAALGFSWFAPHLLAGSVAQLFQPLSLMGVQPTVLTLGEFPQRLLIGQSLTLEVTASGRLPAAVRLRSWHAGKEHNDLMLVDGPGLFRYTFRNQRDALKFQAVAGAATSDVGEVEVVEAPAIGNFRVRYQYPDYTGLPGKITEGTGHLEALPGSEVRIQLAANKPIAQGQLIFDDHTQLPLSVRADGLLQATAVITKPGGYRVQVQDAHGFFNQDQVDYRIDIIPDTPPQVDLQAPEPEVDLDEARVITLEYEARDDFGVRDLTLVYRVGAFGEKRLVIDRVDEVATRYRGRYHWDVTDLFSDASEAITYYLEVWDTDTVSGPKRGVSATHTLRLRGREEEHRRLDELQQQVAEKLIDLLADQLDLNARTADAAEASVPDAPQATQELAARQADLQGQAQALVSQLDQMLQMLEKDYLSDYTRYEDTHALRDQLNFTQESLMEGARQQLAPQTAAPPQAGQMPQSRQGQSPYPQTAQPDAPHPAFDPPLAKQQAAQSELERLALFAQEIGKRAKMRDLENLAQRMTRAQRNMLDTLSELEKLGKEMDDATREALARELEELEKAMGALMEALSRLPSELPDEFLNSEALQNLELGDMMQTLQQLREQLQNGNLADAKRLAEDMLRSLSQMLAALQSAQRFAHAMPFGQQQGGMERAMGELDRIMQEQSEILRDTGRVEKDLRQRINEHQRHEFGQLQRDLREAIQEAQRQIRESARQAVTENRRSRPPVSSLQRTERALDQILRQLTPEEAAELLRALEDAEHDLSAMENSPSPSWEEFLRSHPDLQATLQQLREALAQAHQRLADLNALDGEDVLNPQQGEELGQLGQRQRAVQERTGALKDRLDQLSQFVPFLSPEMRQQLGEAAEFMGEAQGELDQRRARQAIPPEEEALRRLSQGQQAMQQAMQQMAQRGQMGQMPVPMVLRRPGDPYAFNPQPFPDRSPRDQGRMGMNTRDFKIPGKEEFRAPKQFREEIMEALKRGAPAQFKGQIEQYFKNLTE